MKSRLTFGVDLNSPRVFTNDELATDHEFRVDNVYRDVMYQYTVGGSAEHGKEFVTEPYRFDAHFDYLPVRVNAPRMSPDSQKADEATRQLDQRYAETAAAMLRELGVQRGYALVVGSERGQLAYHLARLSDLQIVVIESDEDAVAENRRLLHAAGLLGTRVSVHHRTSLSTIPYGPFLANLITSDRMLRTGELPADIDKLYPALRPVGGMMAFGSWLDRPASLPSEWSANDSVQALRWHQLSADQAPASIQIHRRDKLKGTGEWTHQYASPDNSSCSQDEMVAGQLTVQWWGKPGARPMPDRGNRNPPPVSSDGRLFIQGNRTLFGVDAYNGTILWAKQIPNMRRANMPRDGSNMVAQGNLLWVSIGNQCVAFDGQTGEQRVDREVPVPAELADSNYDWGYVARIGDDLVGSGVRHGSQYRGDKGEWYAGAENRDVERVTSDFLFATAWYGGEPRWIYQQGVILNSTITIADDVAYFIESRNPAAKRTPSGRMLEEVLIDQVLIALDMKSGNVLWEKPYDFSKCHHVTYMTHGQNTLLVAGTDPKRNFYVYAFDTEDGRELWQHQAPDKKGHHTGQLAHPTIVGNNVYFNKHGYNLRTGEVLFVHDFNWHGCGVMSASTSTIFSRYEYHGMYDLKTKERTELLGIRSGCWLSLIPSGGLLLAPETSAGCSCGHSLQTSIAYVPKSLLDF